MKEVSTVIEANAYEYIREHEKVKQVSNKENPAE